MKENKIQKVFLKNKSIPKGFFGATFYRLFFRTRGSDFDQYINHENGSFFLKRVEEIVDGDLLKYVVEGGSYIREHFWGKYPELLDMVSLKTDKEFVEKLLEEALVAVIQGSAFGLDGYFRISYATSMDNLKKALERIKSFCESLS